MAFSPAHACASSTFSPSLTGVEVLAVEANLVTNYNASVNGDWRMGSPAVELRNGKFCNVTVTYTHPGQNDEINVEAWLPTDDWNGRIQAVGGGGWSVGRVPMSYAAMQGSLADGFSTITTDAGVGEHFDASPWALVSPGNVNMYKFRNFASVALHEQVRLPVPFHPVAHRAVSGKLLTAVAVRPWQRSH